MSRSVGTLTRCSRPGGSSVIRAILSLTLLALLSSAAPAAANHIPGQPCSNCASHDNWPTIQGLLKKAQFSPETFHGSELSDELLGHHGSDKLFGAGGSDVLWGDWQGGASQPTAQRDRIMGGGGNDFIY